MGAVQIEHGVVLEGEGGAGRPPPDKLFWNKLEILHISYFFIYPPLENILLRRPCSVCRMKEKTREEKW